MYMIKVIKIVSILIIIVTMIDFVLKTITNDIIITLHFFWCLCHIIIHLLEYFVNGFLCVPLLMFMMFMLMIVDIVSFMSMVNIVFFVCIQHLLIGDPIILEEILIL